MTTSDLETWKGWCEVESEPAFFDVMIRGFGVNGVKVQEVFSLDDEMVRMLPKPIHGLIFLFQFREDDPTMQEATCPEHIWFANQTTSNACATIALLNILLNTKGVDLGPTLEQLKEFSMSLSPALRGYVVGNHDYLRKIHNSFSRKMDMLNADLYLSNTTSLKKTKTNSSKEAKESDQVEASFHFVAFVPIDGALWKLDGLERQPMNLGSCQHDDWMNFARPIIEERMRQYEDDQIQFSLLAVCQSPLVALRKDLSDNICAISAVEQKLHVVQPDWRQFVPNDETHKATKHLRTAYGITKEIIDAASIPTTIETGLINAKEAAPLLELRRQLYSSQKGLEASLRNEAISVAEDDERAATRQHDYTPLVNAWVAALARKGVLKKLVKAASREQYD